MNPTGFIQVAIGGAIVKRNKYRAVGMHLNIIMRLKLSLT